MHFYIDGYNLLFRILKVVKNLQEKREAVLRELAAKIQAVDLSATIVFDAHYQPGPDTRGHFKNLEIVYTGEKETADDYIHKAILRIKNARFITVVTSDKKLAWLCRTHGANTQSVASFLTWLNRRYKNELIPKPKEEKVAPKKTQKKLTSLPTAPPKPGTLAYYQAVFEAEVGETPTTAPEIIATPEAPCEESPTPEQESEFNRWLRLFQRRDKN